MGNMRIIKNIETITTTRLVMDIEDDNSGKDSIVFNGPIKSATRIKSTTVTEDKDAITDVLVDRFGSNMLRVFYNMAYPFSSSFEKIDTAISRTSPSRAACQKQRLSVYVLIPEDVDKIVGMLKGRIKYSSDGGNWILSLINRTCYMTTGGYDTDAIFMPDRRGMFVIENGELKLLNATQFYRMVLDILERNNNTEEE